MRSTLRKRVTDSHVPRVVSFIVLLAILLLVGAYFFQVMAHFVVPLFLAAVLVVVFKPLHSRVVQQLPGRPKISALITTLLILLAVLLPTVWLGWKAVVECRDVYRYLSASAAEADDEPEDVDAAEVDVDVTITVDDAVEPTEEEGVNEQVLSQVVDRAPQAVKDLYKSVTGTTLTKDRLRPHLDNARGAIGAFAVSGLQVVIKVLFGLVIMVLALYYFLADGPKMLAGLMKMSPLDDEYERELLDKFANVSRAVVVASLASAVAQGLLAGAGYYFALNAGAPVFLLTMLTMVLAIVPFAGAAAVWIPTAIWIYLYQPVYENGQPLLDAAGKPVEGDAFAAICLAIFGACVVSAIDNVIKPLVLHGQSNLHPLVALISILGGVQTLGPIGILVGPMLVAFIQALLNMVNKELARMGEDTLMEKHGARGSVIDESPDEIADEAAAKLLAHDETSEKSQVAAKSRTVKGAPAPGSPTTTGKRRRRRK